MKKFTSMVLSFSLVLVLIVPAQADNLTDYNKKKSTVTNKLNSIAKEEKKVQQKISQKKDEKQDLLAAQKKNTKEYQQLQEKLNYLAEQQKLLEADLALSETKYSQQQELLKKRLKVMYENSSLSYLYTLLQSQSLVDFLDRLQLISVIAKSDKELVDFLALAKKDVEFKKAAADSAKREVALKASAKEVAINKITVSRADVENELKKYQSTLEELQRQEDALAKESAEINAQIKKIMSTKKYSGGIMKWPVPSCTLITSSYGSRIHPILKKRQLHTGIDIGARRGASIIAAAKGTVIVSGWKTGYGYTVIIDHGGGIATLYGHASKLLVRVGDNVASGETIAKVGSTGWSTGPHLHFEIRKNGEPVNPLKYVTSK